MPERYGQRVMEPSLDPKTYDVNGMAVAINLVMLYGFAAISLTLPTYLGVAQRGFFCDDDTIRYEYRPDTVGTVQLILYNLGLNAFGVLIVEYYRMYKIESNIDNPKYRWRNNHIHILFVRMITFFGYSQIGFVMNMALNTATKHVVGRLRPHFLDVCKLANDTCVTGNEHRYIINYECTGKPEIILEARKSFYSGHSAISLYCAVWTALYIQARLSNVLHNRIFVPIVQTIILGCGMAISFTRITDNKHHWSDVLVGIFVGSFLAIYTCIYWTGLFKNNKTEDETTPLIINRPTTSRIEPRLDIARELGEVDHSSIRVTTA
ncbi:unnamed protein product [Caenorhabditis angaria]|uniref:Phosphatidic acid phosphatase type 2/haloperoxidase domain-containing protein n=1 Tax=Caenorhabditis angaria TaxID=860376 RepID=A0A9P1IUH5_9PELO|nr:unnamed protein product [Caenorhabditis angaria]